MIPANESKGTLAWTKNLWPFVTMCDISVTGQLLDVLGFPVVSIDELRQDAPQDTASTHDLGCTWPIYGGGDDLKADTRRRTLKSVTLPKMTLTMSIISIIIWMIMHLRFFSMTTTRRSLLRKKQLSIGGNKRSGGNAGNMRTSLPLQHVRQFLNSNAHIWIVTRVLDRCHREAAA